VAHNRKRADKDKRKKELGTTLPVKELKNKIYGTHDVGEVLFDLDKPFNITTIDPGHAELINSVRLHKTETGLQQLVSSFAPIVKRSSRREAKSRFLQKENKSTFRLTNRQWAHNTGRLIAREKTYQLHKKLDLQQFIDVLDNAASKTASLQEYLLHTTARTETAPAFIVLMRLKCTSRWKYRSSWRFVSFGNLDCLGQWILRSHVYRSRLGSKQRTACPTSKGHNSAPNKGLRQHLSISMPIVLGSEYNSTKLSSCCRLLAKKLATATYTGRGTAVQCHCGKMHGRDENAAHNVLYIFQHQNSYGGEIPDTFRPT
jgi:transposase